MKEVKEGRKSRVAILGRVDPGSRSKSFETRGKERKVVSHSELFVALALSSGEGAEGLGVLHDEGVNRLNGGGGERKGDQVVNKTDSSLMVCGSEVLMKPLLGQNRRGTVDGKVVHRRIQQLVDDGKGDDVALVPGSYVSPSSLVPRSLQTFVNSQHRSTTRLELGDDLMSPG